MIELGKIQNLQIIREAEFGVYLNDSDDLSKDDILLPKKQVPENAQIGESIEVFVYRDSKDRMIATTRKPLITLGEMTYLKVLQTTRIGAFLDWGLEKDLFLPFKEQTNKVQQGRKYLVSLYVDKSDRLCATMDIGKFLTTDSPYKEGEHVKGIIYSVQRDIGAFVAVDGKYHGLIPKHEFYGENRCGDEVQARITKVKEDGKLDLSLRKKAYKQMDTDTEILMEKLMAYDGIFPLTDHSEPNEIKRELNMSKRAFKRAVGRLLKAGKIKIHEHGIEWID